VLLLSLFVWYIYVVISVNNVVMYMSIFIKVELVLVVRLKCIAMDDTQQVWAAHGRPAVA
jgi:hypothetical protein